MSLFKDLSMAGTGLLVLVLSQVLAYFGFDTDEGAVASFVQSLFEFVGAVLLFWGQLRRSDLDYGLLRK